jgi:hypothetical protein
LKQDHRGSEKATFVLEPQGEPVASCAGGRPPISLVVAQIGITIFMTDSETGPLLTTE